MNKHTSALPPSTLWQNASASKASMMVSSTLTMDPVVFKVFKSNPAPSVLLDTTATRILAVYATAQMHCGITEWGADSAMFGCFSISWWPCIIGQWHHCWSKYIWQLE